ncbi:hypothetical protein NHQ30_011651 [Ciborinia camelliae]|nr:hypothetical protein NHQ30_011651 [Ciborinia camelliae]
MRCLLLIPCFFLGQIFAAPAPYIVTSYVEVSVYTYEAAETIDGSTYPAGVETLTEAIVPNATPVTNAIKTLTDTSEYAQVTIIEVFLPPGSGHRSTATTTAPQTSYMVPITYKPYPSCTGSGQNWTYVTTVHVNLPTIIASFITPTSLTTSASTYTEFADIIDVQTQVEAFLNPTDVASVDLAMASDLHEPYLMSYCYTPTTTCTTVLASASCNPTWAYPYSSSSNNNDDDYGSDSDDNAYYCDGYGYCGTQHTILVIAICVPVCWIGFWLLIGLFESWFSFKGIMMGKRRKRGIPYAWACISLWFLCCRGPTYKAKSEEEQERLAIQWKEMGIPKKLQLWLKWGFRWKYPDMLGDEPERYKRPFRDSEGCL